MGNLQCRWVRDRLPLLAGDELRGADLRRVERHLISCLKCREHRAALDQTLQILHTVAAQPLVPSDSPSLWPDLARQIRHSRRPAQAPLFTLSRRFGLWPAFGLGFGLLVAVVAVGTRHQLGEAPAPVVNQPRPAAPLVADTAPEPQLAPLPLETLASADTLANVSVSVKPQGEVAVAAETVPATRYGYDLDHTMPMPAGNESRENSKQPTY